MTRSLYMLGAAALAYTGTAVAAEEKTYQLSDSFNSLNFFDNFDFFESKFDTGNYNDVDPTSGYVNYRSRSDAETLGLIATQGTEMYIGVDHANILDVNGKGRSSVRLESKKSFDSGLIIAKFSHLPAPVCGTWPGYWMYGSNWPTNGEIDIYENWNNAPHNLITLHTDHAADVGTCVLSQSKMSDPIVTPNCDNNAPGQYSNQGCGATEVDGLWGSDSGGVCKSCLSTHVPYIVSIHVLTCLQTLQSGPMMLSASGAGPGAVSPRTLTRTPTRPTGAHHTFALRALLATSRKPSTTRRLCSTSTSAARRPATLTSGTPSAEPRPTRARALSRRLPTPSTMSSGRSSLSMSSSLAPPRRQRPQLLPHRPARLPAQNLPLRLRVR
jgi:hypothetical protein